MIYDANLVFGTAAALPTSTGASVVGSAIHYGKQGINDRYAHVFVTTAAASAGGTATVRFEIVRADDSGVTTNVTPIASSTEFAEADLTAGTHIAIEVPAESISGEYVALRAVVGGEALTAGAVTAFLHPENSLDWQAVPAVSGL